MIIGFTILVLLIVRLIVRFTTKHPEWASTGNKLFDWVGGLTHWGLYLLTFGMVITGIILADPRGILARTFSLDPHPHREVSAEVDSAHPSTFPVHRPTLASLGG